MRDGLFIVLWLGSAVVFANEVYRSVDESGRIIFSDEPSEGAERIEIRKPQSIRPLSNGKFNYTPPAAATAPVYNAVEITAPRHDEAIRENTGNIAVSVKIEPALLPGHKVYLYLDGQERQGGGTSFNLNNLDRGTHTLRAVIKDSGERIMKSSTTIVFHVLRHSVLHKNAPAQRGYGTHRPG